MHCNPSSCPLKGIMHCPVPHQFSRLRAFMAHHPWQMHRDSRSLLQPTTTATGYVKSDVLQSSSQTLLLAGCLHPMSTDVPIQHASKRLLATFSSTFQGVTSISVNTSKHTHVSVMADVLKNPPGGWEPGSKPELYHPAVVKWPCLN